VRFSIIKKQDNKMLSILIIDDDPKVFWIISEFYEDKYNLSHARDGIEGIEEAISNNYDIILIDIKMPGMSGIDVLMKLKRLDIRSLMIMLSGHGESKYVTECYKYGAIDFIFKPFDVNEIDELIDKIKLLEPEDLEVFRLKARIKILESEISYLREEIPNRLPKSEHSAEMELLKFMIADFAHGLKGEFALIGALIQLININPTSNPEINNECRDVEKSIMHCQFLVTRLIVMLELGAISMKLLKPSDLLSEIESLAQHSIPPNIKLTLQSNIKDERIRIKCYPEHVNLIIWELIKNAMGAIHHKSGVIEMTINELPSAIEIIVQDNGSGIADSDREIIFKKRIFSQHGLGLGLYLSKKLITLQHGSLELKHTSHKGTTFSVLLPKADAKE
jgi:signal transduction histidine kinase